MFTISYLHCYRSYMITLVLLKLVKAKLKEEEEKNLSKTCVASSKLNV